jgi:hypothetical protein
METYAGSVSGRFRGFPKMVSSSRRTGFTGWLAGPGGSVENARKCG